MEITINSENVTRTSYFTGLSLALISCLFIGSSFIIKKLSLLRLNKHGCLRAGAGGFGYLKDWMWWMGFLTMGLGELANFAAYVFLPASLVTPLGALSVLVSAVLASKFLNEKLNDLGKLGCLLCILGSIIIVIHAPQEEEVESIDKLIDKLQAPNFIKYVAFVILLTVSVIFYFGPRYGNRHVSVYIILCSSIGSLTVMTCKCLGLIVKESFSYDVNKILCCTFFLVVIVLIFIQMNYLNKALDLFNTNIVTPVYYVMFTTLVIIASTILFNEWGRIEYKDVLGSSCGFFVVIIAMYILQSFKDVDINLNGSKYNVRHCQFMKCANYYVPRSV